MSVDHDTLAEDHIRRHGAPEVIEQLSHLIDYVESRTARRIAEWLLTQPSLEDAARLLRHGEWKTKERT